MTRLAAVICMLLLPALACAQDADGDAEQPAAALPATAPPVINDSTIGTLRMRQVGSILLPEGKPPFPAVVVMHGCNGVSPNTRAWARRLASWGYAALIVDSFSSRGIQQVCDRVKRLPGNERARDAFAAAAYLRARPDIDPERIGALGYSHGGWTLLNAAVEKQVKDARATPLRAIVAYYPFCPQAAPPLATDVQIFIGDADDWAPPQNCPALVDKYAADAPHRPALLVYPGAKHSFEVRAPDRMYFGHHLVFDAKAAEDSFKRTREFLDSHLKK